MEQRDDEGRNPCAVLHGGRDPVGKPRSGELTAVPTPTGVGAMLGHYQRLRLGEIEDLPGAVLGGRIRGQVRTAACAMARVMIEGDVRLGHLTQGLALVPGLSARFLARGLPQTGRPRRLLEPIAGWRLPAVPAVEPPLALQLRYAGGQGGNGLLRCG
jgi:hypothetical protein